MGELAVALEEVIEEHISPFIRESRSGLAADAAGKAVRVAGLEPMLGRLLLALTGVIVAHLAKGLRAGRGENSRACKCGATLRYKVTRERSWGTLFGELRFGRAYYRCEKCKASSYPLDVVWGLRPVEEPASGRQLLTPRASARLATLSALSSYGSAAKEFLLLSGMQVSGMLAWRTVQRIGKALRAQKPGIGVAVAEAAKPGKGRKPLRWLVSGDGIFAGFWKDARRRRRKEDAKPIKRRKGIQWSEVKVGVVAQLDESGAVVRGSQWYVAGLEKAAAFRQALWCVATARGVRVMDIVAVVTDGAKWLRALATRHFTWAVAIRDFYHASGHLRVMAEALYGEGSRRVSAWHRQMAHRLKHGGIDAMLAEWERPKRKPLNEQAWLREVAYFRAQREAMRYDVFAAQKLPIGSGCMEAACKTVVAARAKVAGARWTREGLLCLLAVRVCHLNGQSLDSVPLRS